MDSDARDYLIDVSSYNQVDDWNAVRSNNITGAWSKLTQGDYCLNPLRDGQISGARGAGILVGGYHFADPHVSVQANVECFVSEAKRFGLLDPTSLMAMLDIEDDARDHIVWNPRNANAFIADWIRIYRADTGIEPVTVYANLSFWRNILRPDEWADEKVTLHLALYNGDPGNTGGWNHPRLGLHQHTDRGKVPGVIGFVDRDVTVNGRRIQSLTNSETGAFTVPDIPTDVGTPPRIYTVRAGDTLSAIADAQGTTVSELLVANPAILDPDLIYPGQVLALP